MNILTFLNSYEYSILCKPREYRHHFSLLDKAKRKTHVIDIPYSICPVSFQAITPISIPPKTTPLMWAVCSVVRTMPSCQTGKTKLIIYNSSF